MHINCLLHGLLAVQAPSPVRTHHIRPAEAYQLTNFIINLISFLLKSIFLLYKNKRFEPWQQSLCMYLLQCKKLVEVLIYSMYLCILVEILNRRNHRPTRLALSLAVTGSSGLPPLGKTVNHLPKLPSSTRVMRMVRVFTLSISSLLSIRLRRVYNWGRQIAENKANAIIDHHSFVSWRKPSCCINGASLRERGDVNMVHC